MAEKTEAQERKEQCLRDLREAMPRYLERLAQIDQRIHDYALDLVRTDIDIHNIDELLGFRKFLRLLDTYEYDYEAVKDALYDAEGLWEPERPDNPDRSANPATPEGDGIPSGIADRPASLRHVRGGLKIDGIYGYTYYRQTYMQVFAYAWIYGFRKWVDTTSPVGSREMMATERAGNPERPDNPDRCATPAIQETIWDKRRLCRTMVLLWPRKMAKTFTSSFVLFEELMHGARDSQNYIASNGMTQSKVLWQMVDNFVTQLDGWARYFRRSDNDQHRFLKWRNQTGRTAEVVALSANNKTKDGLKATVIAADEFGAAKRVGDKAADMEGLINVLEGSQGPIREPLTLHSSTAGLGVETPYELMVNAIHESLLQELEIPLDGQPHPTDNDWQGCIMLRPDEWERDDENELRTERVIRKVNPNVGITIQPDYYLNEWKKADADGEMKRKEVITKLYNVFASDRAVDWITGEEVRPLMRYENENEDENRNENENENEDEDWPTRIEECKAEAGWIVLTGMDFTNVGDDLQAATYLAARRRQNGRMQFFAQFEAWVTMEAVLKNPYKNLLLQWGEEGYLHIVDKKTISTSMVFDRIVSLRNDHGCNMLGFGYDPFKAKEIVNDLRMWIAGFGIRPEHIGNYIMPVGQTYGSVNPVLEEATALIRDEDPMIRFAYSPLVPWEFSNCRLVESSDGMENKKIIKSRPENKVDNCQALLNALAVFDQMQGKIIR